MIKHERIIRFSSEAFSEGGIRPSALQYEFQEIGGEHAGSAGMGIAEMVADGHMWAVTKIRYVLHGDLAPDTDYHLVTYPRPKRGMLYQRDYQIFTADDAQLLCEGISQWCIMDFNSRRIIRVNKDFVGEFDTNPILPDGFPRFRPDVLTPAGSYTITVSDLDGNNHTNNCRYADMVERALPNVSPADFTINFARETRLGDVIELFTSVTPEGKTIVSGSMDGETVFSALV